MSQPESCDQISPAKAGILRSLRLNPEQRAKFEKLNIEQKAVD
jgi:hypothetical protein